MDGWMEARKKGEQDGGREGTEREREREFWN